APIGVALQAALPVIGHRLPGCRELMRIVAGNASESPPTRAEAAAFVHLLDLADETVLGRAGGPLEHRPEPMERQPGSKILSPTVQPHDAPLADQVALLADGISERGLQRGGIDDREIPAADDRGTSHVELTGPVAPLAADRLAPEDR